MADYTPTAMNFALFQTRSTPIWKDYTTSNLLMAYDVSHSLSGTVKLSNVAQSGKIVRLYYRPNGAPIKTVTTDSNGTFTFSGLDSSDTGNYFAVAFLDDAGYNALVFDKLTAG